MHLKTKIAKTIFPDAMSFLLGNRPGGVFLTQKHFLGHPHQLLLLPRSRNHQLSYIISILHHWRWQLRQWQSVTLITLSMFCSSIVLISLWEGQLIEGGGNRYQ